MAYIDDLVVYNEHLANYKKGLLSLQDIQAKYNTIKSAYDAEMVKYNKALQDLQALLNTEGYINRPLGQPLVFTSEPNATKTLSGAFQYNMGQYKNQLDTIRFFADTTSNIGSYFNQPRRQRNLGAF